MKEFKFDEDALNALLQNSASKILEDNGIEYACPECGCLIQCHEGNNICTNCGFNLEVHLED